MPHIWAIEMAQFTMAAYYLLGGGFSMMLGAHVRMDVLYGKWTPKRRAITDAITIFCMIFYLAVLLIGGLSSTIYSLEYGQRNYSSWGPLLAAMFIVYIAVRCSLQPQLGPSLPVEERQMDWSEKFRLLAAGILPLIIIFSVTGLFMMGITSLVESSAVGAAAATIAALAKGRLTRKVMDFTLHKTLSVSCMFMWIILAALCFGAVFDGLGAVHAIESLFLDKWASAPGAS